MSYEIYESDFVALRSFAHRLSILSEWDELCECTLLCLNKILSSDCACWNEWTPGFKAIKRFEALETYREQMEALWEPHSFYIENHPVLQSLGWNGIRGMPYRMSDFQSLRKFRENPLFKEVYSHLDSHHQLAYHFASTSSSELVLTVNKRLSDFSKRDSSLLKAAGEILAPFVHKIHQNEQVRRHSQIVSSLMEGAYGLVKISSLSVGEINLLTLLSAGQSVSSIAISRRIRRDTISRQLSQTREKLCLTSNKELLATLCSTSHFR